MCRGKATVTCREHGDFSIIVDSHIGKQASGCRACARNGYNTGKPGYLYILSSGDITKVGITNRKVEDRQRSISRTSGLDFNILHSYHFTNGAHASEIETILLRELRATHKQPSAKFDGSTECFISVDLPKLTDKILSYIKQLPSSITKKETLP